MLIHGSDAQRAVPIAKVSDVVRVGVAHGHDRENVVRQGIVEGVAQDGAAGGRSQRQVDDAGSVIRGVSDARSDVGGRSRAIGTEHLDRHQAAPTTDSGGSRAVVDGGGSDAGDVRAMTERVRRALALDVILG